jgi:dethiobiotin synthetase
MRGLFVTGTDTGCGKTQVATALIQGLRQRGLRVAGFKPVAAGAEWHDGILQNDDALALSAASELALPYATVNPYCFAPPVSPHLAAAEVDTSIRLEQVRAAAEALAAHSDLLIAEGAGGWLVPLGPALDMPDLVRVLGLPVLLVVGLRLGCLNHARLSELAIRDSGARLLGWVGSQIDPQMARLNENIATLQRRLSAPCLGVLGHPKSNTRLERPLPLDLDACLEN